MRKVLLLTAALLTLFAAQAWAGGAFVYSTGAGKLWQFSAAGDDALSPLSPASANISGSYDASALLELPSQIRLYLTEYNGSFVATPALSAAGTATFGSGQYEGSGTAPEGAALTPDGQSLYVADHSGQLRQYSVGASGTLTLKNPQSVTVSSPTDVVVAPDGKLAYAASQGDGKVYAFDTGSTGLLSARTSSAVGSQPDALALTPDGRFLLVARPGAVAAFAVAADGSLTAVGSSVTGAATVDTLTVTPDGRHAYEPDSPSSKLFFFDIGADGHLAAQATPSTALTGYPSGVAVTPDGRSAYVATQGAVDQFDITATGALTPKVPASLSTAAGSSGAVTVSPDVLAAAGFSAAIAPAGTPSNFDASSSVDQDGHPAHYAWDFGDGTTLPDGGVAPSHTYAAAGNYTVSVRVTDDRGCSAPVWTGHQWLCQGPPPVASLAVEVAAAPVAAAPPPPPAPVAPGAVKLVRAGSPRLSAAEGGFRLDTGVSIKCPLSTAKCAASVGVVLLRHGKKPLTGLVTSAVPGVAGKTTPIVVPIAAQRTAALKKLTKAKLAIQIGATIVGGPGAQDARTVTLRVPTLKKKKAKK